MFKLLTRRWRGTIFKLVWRDLLIWSTIFCSIRLFVHSPLLDDADRRKFLEFVEFTGVLVESIPLSFVLGFFVMTVMTRWWDTYKSIPWPYGIAVFVSSTVQGYDEVGRAMRRTIMRYVCLSLTMVFRVMSFRVLKRFPKMSDLVDAGLLMKSELEIIEDLDRKYQGYSKNWLPIVWAASIVNRARDEGRINDDIAVKMLLDELNKFRGSCGTLMNYHTIYIPLVYTHIVTLAVYVYFITCIFSEQIVKIIDNDPGEPDDRIDTFFPLKTMFQFVLYVGWLKVAETMMNPFGGDDDDFDVNFMIDRNIQMSYLIVDDHDHPELLKDAYWKEIPTNLPDHGKSENEEQRPGEKTDIFDADENSSLMSSIPSVSSESVTPQSSREKPISTTSRDSVNLRPRSTVIDGSYLKLEGIEEKQSRLEREMEKIRRKVQSEGSESISIIDSRESHQSKDTKLKQ